MILELLLSAIKGLLNLVVSLLPSLPELPDAFTGNLDTIFEFLRSSLGLFYFFIRPSTVMLALPISLAIVNFEHIYRFSMWIIRKIPFINVK